MSEVSALLRQLVFDCAREREELQLLIDVGMYP